MFVFREILPQRDILKGLPAGSQVLRYSDGEKYGPHYDSADHSDNNTKASIFAWLSDTSKCLNHTQGPHSQPR